MILSIVTTVIVLLISGLALAGLAHGSSARVYMLTGTT